MTAGRRILVVQTADGAWVLPKGKLRPGEDREPAALREVAEESGLRARIVRDLGDTRYSFESRGSVVEKIVYWFLMEPEAATVVQPTPGFREVAWLSVDEAAARLTYTQERSLVAGLISPPETTCP